jgi:hypothetical protein
MSIIAGVKGLFFYVGSGQKDYQGKPAGLLNKPVEAHWDYVQQLARELRELSPVIMAPCSPAKLELAPTNAPVEFITRQLEGKLYLLAANKSGQSQPVRFTGEALRNRKAQTLYEDHAAKVDGATLTDEFSAFAVHVYRLE